MLLYYQKSSQYQKKRLFCFYLKLYKTNIYSKHTFTEENNLYPKGLIKTRIIRYSAKQICLWSQKR